MANIESLALPALHQRAGSYSGPATWEKTIALAGMVLIFGTFKSLLLSGGSARTEGSAFFQVLTGGVYLAAIAGMVLRGIPAWMPRLLLYALPLVLLTLLPLLSTVWSQDPAVTFRRAFALVLCFGFSLFLVQRFDLKSLFNLFAVAFVIFMVVSALAVLIPGVGITPDGPYAGAWRGMTGQKNVFGRTLALGLSLMPLALIRGLTDRWRAVLFIAVFGFFLLVLSRSATSLVTVIVSSTIGPTLFFALGGRIRGIRLRPEIGITLLCLVAMIVAITVTYGWTPILEALGRDPTLTGRTKLWQWAMSVNEARSWLGSGYRAFWIDANTKYFFEVFAWAQDADGNLSDSFNGPDHSHSGYMDTYLELGLLGVTMLGVVLFSALFNLRRALHAGAVAIGSVFAAIITFVLIYAVTEKSILQQSEDLWFFFVTIYLLTVRETIFSKSPELHKPDARVS